MKNLEEDVAEIFGDMQALGGAVEYQRNWGGHLEGARLTTSVTAPERKTPEEREAEIVARRPVHTAWKAPERDGERLCPGHCTGPHWAPIASFMIERRLRPFEAVTCADCRAFDRLRKAARLEGWDLGRVLEITDNGRVSVGVWKGGMRYFIGSRSFVVGERVWIRQRATALKDEGGRPIVETQVATVVSGRPPLGDGRRWT